MNGISFRKTAEGYKPAEKQINKDFKTLRELVKANPWVKVKGSMVSFQGGVTPKEPERWEIAEKAIVLLIEETDGKTNTNKYS